MCADTVQSKECPKCRTPVAAESIRCACGYILAQDAHPPSNLVAQAEALVETHLRAQLQRARRTLKLAKVDLLRDPSNLERKTELRAAEKEVRHLEVQVQVQIARVADAYAATAPQTEPEITTPAAPNTFRVVQAVKAEQGLELTRLQLAAEQSPAAETTGLFSAIQAEKARAIEPAPTATPAPSPSDNDVGSNFLSIDERAALRGT